MLHGLQVLLPIVFVLAAATWRLASQQQRSEPMLLLALAIFGAQWIGGFALLQLTRVNLPTYDEHVYRIDGLFGQPSFALGRTLWPHPVAMHSLDAAYQAITLAATIVLALHIWRALEETRWAIYAFLLNFAIAPLVYAMFPVCGPRYAFSSYPFAQPSFSAHPLHLHAPPNGVPSVHLSTALLILWFSRKLPVGRWLAAAYLLCMIVATLGSGEHYLFDLLCAIPYSAFAITAAAGLCHRRSHEFDVRRTSEVGG